MSSLETGNFPGVKNAEKGESAVEEITLVRVYIFDGEQQKKKIIIEVPSSTRVCDLHLHPDLCEYIKNDQNEWNCDGDTLKRVTISNVSRITDKRPIELTCIMEKDKEEEQKEGREEETSNEMIMAKEECRDSALDLMNTRSISPFITQSNDNSAHFQADSVQEDSKILTYPANEINDEANGSIPGEREEKNYPLLDTSRTPREVASKVFEYTESIGEKEEEKSDDEDYEETEKEEEEEEKKPPAKKRKIEKKEQNTAVSIGPKREMECPKCRNYRSTSVDAITHHLIKKHGTRPYDAGIMFVCDCGHKNASSAHTRFSQCNLLNFKIVLEKKYSGERCILCETHLTTMTSYGDHLCRKHHSSLRKYGNRLVCACGLGIRSAHCAKNHVKNCTQRNFKVEKYQHMKKSKR